MDRLKKAFPHLSIMLLLDGMFASGPAMGLCRRNSWQKFHEEGILVEKRRGYHYEHCFSYNWNAMMGYHHLMRIGHLLNVLPAFSAKLVQLRFVSSMKVKTSITLSEELLREIDQIIEGYTNRSVFIEEAVRSYLKQRQREQREKADLEILNQHATRFNKEAADVLSYQVEL